MAATTVNCSVPLFFVKLGPQWAGICNGTAAGIILAAS
ncbi:ZIP transporter [Corchorus olitorius]|uniref:ZIP transporter n=1 Tax=Corchorus olitorius TaxID=93759 RepID=A0A1R3KLW8_9ROSI|nr:ZIP transporter [Corchorus olitorius]